MDRRGAQVVGRAPRDPSLSVGSLRVLGVAPILLAPMLIEKLSVAAQGVTERACRLAVKDGHQFVTESHLMLALLSEADGATRRYLETTGADVGAFEKRQQARLQSAPRAAAGSQDTPINRDLEAVFVRAEEALSVLGTKFIGLDHLLLGLLEDVTVREDLAGSGATEESLASLASLVGTKDAKSASNLDDYELLKKFTVDLTAKARAGKLDRVIGRDGEIRHVIQVLSRRLKNNPVIVGEPGVGKTAVVEGLAQRVVQGTVPENLLGHLVVSLDVGMLLAGTKFRGEFEERLKNLLAEVSDAGNILLFIDEVHMMVGAGGKEGGTDASNLLKPALSRGDFRCIGSTTLAEYRKHIEKDAALSRRFQLVMVDEPTVEQTITILRGLKETYEVHHGVKITDAAINAAVRMSVRYISDRFLPDKAIDLVDQAAANIRMELASRPEEIEKQGEEIVRLEIEIRALEQDNDNQPTPESTELRGQLETLKAEHEALNQVWQKEKQAVIGVQEAKRDLEEAKREMETQIREENYARVAELQYKIIPDREKRAAELGEIELDEVRFLRQEVLERDVAETVARVTGIPVKELLDSEAERLMALESHLAQRVVGQEEPVAEVAKALRRARAGVQDPNRPLASFLLLGSTGVGKTELTKALAEQMFGSEKSLLRFDMSEYMEKHAVARLVGAPPGYVGYDEGGLLTNKVRRKPYSVILFDEVEKAHADIFNLLLQVFDEGHLTDGQGTTVDFKNTIIILTSNLGASAIDAAGRAKSYEEVKASVTEAVRGHFRAELLNRLDDTVVFRPLTREIMKPIVRIQVNRVAALLADRKCALEVTDAALEHLAEAGYHPEYGARPLKRLIRARIQDALAELIIRGELGPGDTVRVDVTEGGLSVVVAPEAGSA